MKALSFSDPNLYANSVVVSAGAGSGKTFTLTALVLTSLGRMEARPYEIIAATFSEAAAADLRERLLRPLDLLNSFSLDTWGKLLPIGSNSQKIITSLGISSGELLEALTHFGSQPWMKSPKAAQSFWRRTRREAELMHVSTLHSLALGLLRTGDGSPDRILEADHPALLRLLRNALREVANVPENSPGHAPAKALLKWAERQWEKISLAHDAHRDALGHYEGEPDEKVQDELIMALKSAQGAMKPFAESPDAAKDPNSKSVRYFDLRKILPLPAADSPFSSQIQWAEKQSGILDYQVDELPGYYSPDFAGAAQTITDIASAWEARLRLILIQALKRFEELKHARRMATFGDIVRSALAGLSEGTIAPPRPKLLLVDEYQDTSIAQDAFINALGAERIVRVGDVKQAIYGFRGGTSDLLKKHIENAGNSAFRLSFNFRSAPPIVDLANSFVEKIWPAIDPAMESLEAGQKPRAKGGPPVGAVLTTVPSRGTNLPALSEWIAALSDESGWEQALGNKAAASSAPKGQRALLLRQRTKLPVLLLSLKQKGIKPYVLSKEGFWDSPGPRLMMAAFEAIAYPNRRLPFAVLLRHLVGLSDMDLANMGEYKGLGSFNLEKLPEEKRPSAVWLQGLKKLSAQQIAACLLSKGSLLHIITSLDAHGAMEPERARRNLAGFLAMLQDLPADPGVAYSILDELRNGPERGDLPSTSQNADLIIQTVHGSKGLEYDDVILPLLNNQKTVIRKGQMLTDPDSGSLLFAWKLGAEPGKDYRRIEELIESQERRDGLNLFYVALTRAKNRLCLLLQEPIKTKPKEKISEGQHYSWARIGSELLECYDCHDRHASVLKITDLPPAPPQKQYKKTILERRPNKSSEAGGEFLPAPDGRSDNEYTDNLHFRQEGIEMHAYLQNLLVRWEDMEAFNLVLNTPPHVPKAKELAARFLNDFESRGWRHLRRRTELDLEGASESGTKGSADLVVWGEGTIHLIDFKHISKLTPESTEAYTQQLNRYARAIAKQGTSIKAWLVLLKSGEWVEVSLAGIQS